MNDTCEDFDETWGSDFDEDADEEEKVKKIASFYKLFGRHRGI